MSSRTWTCEHDINILELLHLSLPTAEHLRRCFALVDLLDRHVHECHEHAEIYPYGSLASNLQLPDSDIDVCIRFNGVDESQCSQVWRKDLLQCAKRIFLLFGDADRRTFDAALHARVPVISFRHYISGIVVDVNTMANGVVKSDLTRALMLLAPVLRPLTCVIKYWARRNRLNDSKYGTLNSFSLTLLSTFTLQAIHRPLLPPIWKLLPGGGGPEPPPSDARPMHAGARPESDVGDAVHAAATRIAASGAYAVDTERLEDAVMRFFVLMAAVLMARWRGDASWLTPSTWWGALRPCMMQAWTRSFEHRPLPEEPAVPSMLDLLRDLLMSMHEAGPLGWGDALRIVPEVARRCILSPQDADALDEVAAELDEERAVAEAAQRRGRESRGKTQKKSKLHDRILDMLQKLKAPDELVDRSAAAAEPLPESGSFAEQQELIAELNAVSLDSLAMPSSGSPPGTAHGSVQASDATMPRLGSECSRGQVLSDSGPSAQPRPRSDVQAARSHASDSSDCTSSVSTLEDPDGSISDDDDDLYADAADVLQGRSRGLGDDAQPDESSHSQFSQHGDDSDALLAAPPLPPPPEAHEVFAQASPPPQPRMAKPAKPEPPAKIRRAHFDVLKYVLTIEDPFNELDNTARSLQHNAKVLRKLLAEVLFVVCHGSKAFAPMLDRAAPPGGRATAANLPGRVARLDEKLREVSRLVWDASTPTDAIALADDWDRNGYVQRHAVTDIGDDMQRMWGRGRAKRLLRTDDISRTASAEGGRRRRGQRVANKVVRRRRLGVHPSNM